jgi:hypothetical protein
MERVLIKHGIKNGNWRSMYDARDKTIDTHKEVVCLTLDKS